MSNINISLIAQRANVSKATVSRVINNSPLVKNKTKERVERVIKDLNYMPSELARGLRISETKTIGIIVSNILNPFFTGIVRGVEDLSNAANYNIVLCNTDEEPEKEREYLHTLLSKRVDGLIIASTGIQNDYSQMIKRIPIVFIDRRPDNNNPGAFDTVLVDNIEGSLKVVDHLIKSGYRRIGIIAGSDAYTTGYERLLGYKQALKKNNLEIDDNLIKIGDFLGHTSYENAKELLLDGKCDSIFVTNNIILLGALKAMEELGIKSPRDIGLVTFDDMEWMQYCQPRLTAITQPTYLMGTTAMQLLLDRIANKLSSEPKEIILPVELIVRDSSQKLNNP